jgi:ABC-type phosphate transport system permease subunit
VADAQLHSVKNAKFSCIIQIPVYVLLGLPIILSGFFITYIFIASFKPGRIAHCILSMQKSGTLVEDQ